MINSRNIKLLFLVLSFVILPVKGYGWWLIPGAYYAELDAEVVPSGAGKVYIEGDAGRNEGQNVRHTNTGYSNVTFDVEATVNGGYNFQGWSNNSSGNPLLSTDLEYTTGNYATSGIQSTNSATNAALYKIYALYEVIPYTLTLLPGDHGQGTRQDLDYNAQSTGSLQSSFFTAAPGYQFKDWKVTVADGYWTPVGKTYTNSTISLSAKYGSATLTAEWTAKGYNITYNANGGRVNGKVSQTDTYYIEGSGTVRTAIRSGHTFSGWKVTSVETEGNWTLNQIIPIGTSLNGKYGKVTLTAVWDLAQADITISASGLDQGDTALFTVSAGGEVLYTVPLTGDATGAASVTIKGLETGVQYTVQPVSAWTWAYSSCAPTNYIENLGASGLNASFAFTKNTSAKKHDEKSNANWKP